MTTEYQPLLDMVFKIKFLKAMLPVMTDDDALKFTSISISIGIGEATEYDFAELNRLFGKFEKSYASPLS